jgi:1,4-alpha-glucan branching enzyme
MLVKDLNAVYQAQSALYKHDFDHQGFDWIDCHDADQSVISYRRKDGADELIVVLNFTPVVREQYRIGVPLAGDYHEIFNSDAGVYAGSNVVNTSIASDPTPWMNLPHSIGLRLPPLSGIILKLKLGNKAVKL